MGWVRSRDSVFNFSLLASLICLLAAFAYSIIAPRVFTDNQLNFINGEDGVIEYGTSFFFLVASVLSAILAHRNRAWRNRAAVLLLFSLGCFLCFDEEISWGQRAFNIKSPEFFQEHSYQKEINVHNLLGNMPDHLFFVGIFAYGVILPILARSLSFFHKFFDKLGLPIASLGLAFGFLAVSFSRVEVNALRASLSDWHISEVRELLSAILLVLLMVETWRKAPEDRRPASAGASA